jgi:uncharacterized phage protein (TIGR02220 family)
MEVLLFIKHLKTKGAVYYQIWMPLLIQFNATTFQEIKLSVTPNVPKTSYFRIIQYGVKVFENYVSNYTIKKERSILIIKKADENIVSLQLEKTIQLKKQRTIPKQKTIKETNDIVFKIISHLNQCSGKEYKPNSKIAIKNINDRLQEGYTLEDFKKVIEIKSTKWLGTNMEDYLTPKTLFGEKMELYVNENIIVEKTKQEQNYEQVSKATDLGWNN